MYKNGDKCPLCGEGTLERRVKNKTFSYKGEKITIENFVVFYCSECDDSVVPKTSMKSSERTIRDFQKRVDGLLTSDEIRKIREALGFTQEVFANVLGIGLKNFARYENGTVTQHRTTDHLLRVLFEKPDVLSIISKEARIGVPLERVTESGATNFYNPHFSDQSVRYNFNF